MSYKLELSIAGLPKASANANQNWRIRWGQAKKWKKLVSDRIDYKNRPKCPLNKAKLTLTRYAHGARPDSDNLRASFKHVIDALVESQVLVDDNFDVIGDPVVLWMRAAPKKGYITILVEEI